MSPSILRIRCPTEYFYLTSTEIENSGYLFEFSIDDFDDSKGTEIRVFIISHDGRVSESNYPRPQDTANWHFRPRPRP